MTTTAGFEPARAKPISFRDLHVNHSVTLSYNFVIRCSLFHQYKPKKFFSKVFFFYIVINWTESFFKVYLHIKSNHVIVLNFGLKEILFFFFLWIEKKKTDWNYRPFNVLFHIQVLTNLCAPRTVLSCNQQTSQAQSMSNS